jgi:hypothetical protein
MEMPGLIVVSATCGSLAAAGSSPFRGFQASLPGMG